MVCALSAIGSWAGVTLTSEYSTSAYQKQRAFDWDAKIFDKRVEIMERMDRLIAKQPGVQDEWNRYLEALQAAKTQRIPPRESSEKLEDFNAGYGNVLLLARVYFGPDTKNAVNDLTKIDSPWWMKSVEKEDAVVSAMTKELSLSLPTLTATLEAGRK